jgi:hypothetical protein
MFASHLLHSLLCNVKSFTPLTPTLTLLRQPLAQPLPPSTSIHCGSRMRRQQSQHGACRTDMVELKQVAQQLAGQIRTAPALAPLLKAADGSLDTLVASIHHVIHHVRHLSTHIAVAV